MRKSIEKERNDWSVKSGVTAGELEKFQSMLETIQSKMESKDNLGEVMR